MIFIIKFEIWMFKGLANRFISWKRIIKLKNEALKISRTLYRVDKEIKKDLTINFLTSYVFESRALSLNTLKFVFTTLIVSLLLKVDDVNSVLNSIISDLIDFISSLIDFFIAFILKSDIIKQLFYNSALNIFKSYCNCVENLNFFLNFFD